MTPKNIKTKKKQDRKKNLHIELGLPDFLNDNLAINMPTYYLYHIKTLITT